MKKLTNKEQEKLNKKFSKEVALFKAEIEAGYHYSNDIQTDEHREATENLRAEGYGWFSNEFYRLGE